MNRSFLRLLLAGSIFMSGVASADILISGDTWERVSGGVEGDELAYEYEVTSDSSPRQDLRIFIGKEGHGAAQESLDSQSERETFVTLDGIQFEMRRRYRSEDSERKLPFHVSLVAQLPAGENVMTLRYGLTPTCTSCLKAATRWVELFKTAKLSDDQNVLLFDDGKIAFPLEIQDNVKSQPSEGWLHWPSVSISAIVAPITVFALKMLAGAAGVRGPCGNNMAVCACHQ